MFIFFLVIFIVCIVEDFLGICGFIYIVIMFFFIKDSVLFNWIFEVIENLMFLLLKYLRWKEVFVVGKSFFLYFFNKYFLRFFILLNNGIYDCDLFLFFF